MKKLLAVLLCLMLTAGCALAEETMRTGTVMIEGMNEELVETLYQSEKGYEIWYPSEYVTVGEKYGHECFVPIGAEENGETYFMIVVSEEDAVDPEGLMQEAVGGFEGKAEISEAVWSTTEDSSLLGSVEASDGETVYRFYLVVDENRFLQITACFPAEAAEGFGVRFDRMAETIAFPGVQLTARYEGDGYAIAYPDNMIEPGMVYDNSVFVPAGSGAESEIYLQIVHSSIAPGQADDLLDEAVAGYEGDYTVRWNDEKVLDVGLSLRSAEVEQEGRIDRFYLIQGENEVYCLSASFPAEGDVDYGTLFDAMTDSFELIESHN